MLQAGQSSGLINRLNFREIWLIPVAWLVHSQKNHSLAFDVAARHSWQSFDNMCRLLFYIDILICIKNIQIVTVAFSEAIGKLQTQVVHNIIHRNCAQLFWTIGGAMQPKRVVRYAPLR